MGRRSIAEKLGAPPKAGNEDSLCTLQVSAEEALSDLCNAIRLSDDQRLAAIEVRQLAAQLAVRNVKRARSTDA